MWHTFYYPVYEPPPSLHFNPLPKSARDRMTPSTLNPYSFSILSGLFRNASMSMSINNIEPQRFRIYKYLTAETIIHYKLALDLLWYSHRHPRINISYRISQPLSGNYHMYRLINSQTIPTSLVFIYPLYHPVHLMYQQLHRSRLNRNTHY